MEATLEGGLAGLIDVARIGNTLETASGDARMAAELSKVVRATGCLAGGRSPQVVDKDGRGLDWYDLVWLKNSHGEIEDGIWDVYI